MTPELENYFNNFFDLFRNEGWKQLVEELKTNAIHLNDLQSVKDVDEMNNRKGQLIVLANLINLENTVNASHENALEEDNANSEND